MQLSRSPDLRRLRDDGYDVRITAGGHLVLADVPYVTDAGAIAFGQLVSKLVTAGDVTSYGGNNGVDHVAYLVGGTPCDKTGQPLTKLIHQPSAEELEAGLTAAVGMSSKPDGDYADYHHKMTTYADMISAPAKSIDPSVTARTFPTVADEDPTGPFQYLDTASGRAQISVVTDKLRLRKVSIVGLGGTGSYVLDLVAKTPVGEIHLYDGDDLLTHNAFRAPGAASLDTLRNKPKKVDYLAGVYSNIKRGLIPHPYHVDADTVDELCDSDFVFITMEGNEAKRLIVEKLVDFGVSFVDVGIGVNMIGTMLQGAVQTITRTPATAGRAPERHEIAYEPAGGGNVYDANIQIADLNALNAALAVIRWKKLCGFYGDGEDEHYSVYTIDGNTLINEDTP